MRKETIVFTFAARPVELELDMSIKLESRHHLPTNSTDALDESDGAHGRLGPTRNNSDEKCQKEQLQHDREFFWPQ